MDQPPQNWPPTTAAAARSGTTLSVGGKNIKVKNTFIDSIDDSFHGVDVDLSGEVREVKERYTCPDFQRRSRNQIDFSELLPPIDFEESGFGHQLCSGMDSLLDPATERSAALELEAAREFEAAQPVRLQPTGNSFGSGNWSWSTVRSTLQPAPNMPMKISAQGLEDVELERPAQRRDLLFRSMAAPSRGSVQHGMPGADCIPCTFFWSPSGCLEGRNCGFCHLCPSTGAGAGSASSSRLPISAAVPLQPAPPLLQPAGPAAAAMDSDGPPSAALQAMQEAQRQLCPMIVEAHQTGTCKPCTFFWRSDGCQKATACAHCHLCPPSALRNRKHQKRAQNRMNAKHLTSMGNS